MLLLADWTNTGDKIFAHGYLFTDGLTTYTLMEFGSIQRMKIQATDYPPLIQLYNTWKESVWQRHIFFIFLWRGQFRSMLIKKTCLLSTNYPLLPKLRWLCLDDKGLFLVSARSRTLEISCLVSKSRLTPAYVEGVNAVQGLIFFLSTL